MQKQEYKDETAEAIKDLSILLIKKVRNKIHEKWIPKNYEQLKAMKERLEKEESNRQKAIREHEAVRHLLQKKKQRQQWERQDHIRKIRHFLHLPYKTWIEEIQEKENLELVN